MNWPEDFINKIICGDCLEAMREMPIESIDTIITSPPYWGLRDYGIGPNQLGLEPTPELYIEHLTEIFNEAKRVLKKEGTLWLNIGDTYGGSGCGRHDYREKGSISPVALFSDKENPQQKIMPKCLLMIPERLAWSLIQNGWILRNKIVWHKPNAMPSSVTDRFSNRWEYLFMFSKSQKYYFDLDAVREPHQTHPHGEKALQGGISQKGSRHLSAPKESMRFASGMRTEHPLGKNPGDVIKINNDRKGLNVPGQLPHGIHRKRHFGYFGADGEYLVHPDGKNPGDVFEIATQPFPEAHFAVFPEKLCEKPIKAGCPEEVCKKCGKAKERIVKKYDTGETQKMPDYWEADLGSHKTIHRKGRVKGETKIPVMANKTIGWISCKCNAGFEGGIVLDPFCGAGTALYVAKQLRRRFIGIDIKQEYCDMCKKRLAQGVL